MSINNVELGGPSATTEHARSDGCGRGCDETSPSDAGAVRRYSFKAALLAVACVAACLAVPLALGVSAAVTGALTGAWWLAGAVMLAASIVAMFLVRQRGGGDAS